MITIRNLRVAYGSHVVLNELNVSFTAGIHGIVGLNGAGKTTFLNTIAGLIRPQQGQVHYRDKILTTHQVAYLESEPFFYSRITGREYLRLFQLTNAGFAIDSWGALFELPLDDLIDHYSTGMRKKLAFLGVLCLNKPLLILDEPYNGVDMESYQKMKQVIQALKAQEKLILITSHILEGLTSLCDQIHYLQEGNIAFSADKEAFDQLEQRIFGSQDQSATAQINHLLSHKTTT